ncbi:hypothetical protein EKD04_015765 [Chloroflexales bacterium ZM16-3]|nr:hypothetical protein [Chloroflexales bacterium ZM16-3]
MARRGLALSLIMVIGLGAAIAFGPAEPAVAQTDWSSVGLGQFINALVVDPRNPVQVFATVDSGLRVSQDSGASWGPFITVSTSGPLQSLAINPVSGVLVVVVGDGQIRRSVNGGVTWSAPQSGPEGQIVRDLLYTGGNPPVLYTHSESQIFRSADDGVNWSNVTGNLPDGSPRTISLFALAADSRIPTRLYVGRYGGLGGGLFRSQDGGASWSQPALTNPGGSTPDIVSVAVSPTNPEIVLAGSYGTGRIFRSTDSGGSWSAFALPLGPFEVAYVNDLYFDQTAPGRVFAAVGGSGSQSAGIYVSRDNGAIWTRLDASSPSPLTGNLTIATVAGPFGDVVLVVDGGVIYRRTGASAVPNLSVSRIEVTQAIQTPDRSVTLVQNRPTIARVYLNVESDSDVQGASAVLYATRNGQPLPGSPLRPINPGGVITAVRSPNAERFEHTLNFIIPSSWHPGGLMALSAEVDPDNRITERNENDNRSPNYLNTFLNVTRLKTVLIPIEYQRNGVGPVLRINLRDLPAFGMQGVYDTFPIAGAANSVHSPYHFTGDLTTGAGWSQLLYELALLRARELAVSNIGDALTLPKYYGMLPNLAGSPYLGLAYRNSAVGIGIGSSLDTTAHELAHTFGLQHAPCGATMNPDPNYPIAEGRIGFVGLNVRLRQPMPTRYGDLMSYCKPRWISAYNYEKLFDTLNQISLAQAGPAQAPEPAWLVGGAIGPGGLSGALSLAEPLANAITVTASGSGAYRLELWNAGGVAFAYSFNAELPEAPTTSGLSAGFAFVVPRSNDITELRLLAGDTLLDSISVAQFAPSVSAQLASFNPSDSRRSVTWSVSPAPGESDTTSVRYSADGGQSWQVLGQTDDLAVSSLDFDLGDLAASADGLIEVVVVRGATAGSAQVSIGPVANKPPAVQIVQGTQLQVATNEPLVLQGNAYDHEDGTIPDGNYSWRDEAGQFLDSGPLLELPPLDALTSRVISLSVTDSAGVTAQASVTITAGERIYLPLLRR